MWEKQFLVYYPPKEKIANKCNMKINAYFFFFLIEQKENNNRGNTVV